MVTLTIAVDGHEVHQVEVMATPNKRRPAQWLEALDFTLTDRQIEVLRLAATGMQYKAIAISLGISEKTVRGHMNDIYQRTGIRNNTMLVAWAWLMGLLTEEDIIAAWRETAPHLVQLA